MKQISGQVKSLVLGYFSMINASVTENNGLFDISIPNEHQKFFRKDNLKITFDEKLSESSNYELLSPGNNILFKILNECISFGPVITAKLNSNEQNSTILRFYFYIIFESVKSETMLAHVDVDTGTQKIVTVDDSEINFENNPPVQDISSDAITDCYIEATDYVKETMKSEMQDFKNQIFKLKDEELQNINLEYKKRLDKIQEKSTISQSKGESNSAFQKIIDENETVKQEEIKVRKTLDEKYKITIDFALVTGLVLN